MDVVVNDVELSFEYLRGLLTSETILSKLGISFPETEIEESVHGLNFAINLFRMFYTISKEAKL